MNNLKMYKATPMSASMTFVWRSIQKIKSNPSQLIFDAVVAVVSMLLFTYLFGGAIEGSPREYLQFLLPGMLFMTVLPMTAYAGSTLCNDIAKGIYDRFRTLGFWQPAAVLGTLFSDIIRYSIAVLAVAGTGFAIGFRPGGGFVELLLGLLLVILFAFSISWVFAMWGVIAKKAESVSQNSMILIYTAIFGSNIFIETGTLPNWLQVAVNLNPTTHIATATRGLMHGTATSSELSIALIVCLSLVAVFAPLTFALYSNKNKK